MHFSNPQMHVLQMALAPGAVVADIGAGGGHHSFALHHVVAPNGRVYAIDIQEDLLTRLWHEARRKKHHSIETVWADVEDTLPIADNHFDAMILSNTLFQLENKQKAIAEMKRTLKSGGKLLVVDWNESFNNLGPHEDAVVNAESAHALFTNAGFEKVKDCKTGPHHFAILYTNT